MAFQVWGRGLRSTEAPKFSRFLYLGRFRNGKRGETPRSGGETSPDEQEAATKNGYGRESSMGKSPTNRVCACQCIK